MGESSSAGDRPWQSYHTVYTNAKAGMDGVDKEKVQRVVYEMSKGSKYFDNEKKREAFIKQKIETMRTQCAKLTAADLCHFEMIADKKIIQLEASRDLSKVWLHVDMDAFYAAVEMVENPSLNGKPLAVGSLSMISTANYEARKFGVRAAMPGFIAKKLCPDLIFVPLDFDKYTHYSRLARKVFERYDPHFMATSLDEAYLNITEVCKCRGTSGAEIAEELRAAVYAETGLTCSAGLGPNRLLAKVCSDINKPNGQFVLQNDRRAVMTFISSLPIRKIGGIGKVTESILKDVLGIKTCEEILQKSSYICALFSSISADFFLSVGLGLGNTETPQPRIRKSISSERTFQSTDDEAIIYRRLEDTAENLSSDMEKEGLCGRTLTLKVKTASFEVRSRAITLQKYICSKDDILNQASKLLKAELPLSLRLIGLRMSHFSNEKLGHADPTQKTLENFVISGDAFLKPASSSNSVASGTSKNPTGDEKENVESISFSYVSGSSQWGTYDFGGSLGQDILFDEKRSGHTPSKNDSDTHNISGPTEPDEIPSEFVMDGPAVHEAHTNEVGRLQMIGMDLCSTSGQRKTQNQEESCSTSKLLEDKQGSSSSLGGQSVWTDNYKCSLCGFELPPCFTEERQYHSDYHLAEMLQESLKQASETDLHKDGSSIRSVQNLHSGKGSARKKKKSVSKEGKNLTIDLFFVKDKHKL